MRPPLRRSTKSLSIQQQPLTDTEQSRADAELEQSLLDALTDSVLTTCAHAPSELQQRLVEVLDKGVVRSASRNIPSSAAGSRFSHACLRKLYVVCGRGVDMHGPHSCLLQVGVMGQTGDCKYTMPSKHGRATSARM